MKKIYFKKNITEFNGSDKKFWEENWKNETVEKQLAALRWSGYIPIFEKYIKSGKVLENGCGLGSALQYFHNKNFFTVGLDYLITPLKTLKKFNNKLKLINGNGYNLPFADSSFDSCVSLGVVEHFENGATPLINECYRILKKDGVLIISVPYYNFLERFNFSGAANCDDTSVFYQYLYTKNEFIKLLKNEEMEVIDYKYCNKIGPFYYLYCKIYNKIYNKLKKYKTTIKPDNIDSNNTKKKTLGITANLIKNIIIYLNYLIPGILSAVMITVVLKKKQNVI